MMNDPMGPGRNAFESEMKADTRTLPTSELVSRLCFMDTLSALQAMAPMLAQGMRPEDRERADAHRNAMAAELDRRVPTPPRRHASPGGWEERLRARIEHHLRAAAGIHGVLGAKVSDTASMFAGPTSDSGVVTPVLVGHEPNADRMDGVARAIADTMATSVRSFLDHAASEFVRISHVEVRLNEEEIDRLRGEANYIWIIKADRRVQP